MGVAAQPRKWGRPTKEQRAALQALGNSCAWVVSELAVENLDAFCVAQNMTKVRSLLVTSDSLLQVGHTLSGLDGCAI